VLFVRFSHQAISNYSYLCIV